MKKIALVVLMLGCFSSASFAQQGKTKQDGAVMGMENPGQNPNGNVKETQEKQRILAEEARQQENQARFKSVDDKQKYIQEKRAAIQADKSISKKDKQKQLEYLKKLESGSSQPATPSKTKPAVKKLAPVKP